MNKRNTIRKFKRYFKNRIKSENICKIDENENKVLHMWKLISGKGYDHMSDYYHCTICGLNIQRNFLKISDKE